MTINASFNALSQMEISGDHFEHQLPRVMCLSARNFDKSLGLALLWFLCVSHGEGFVGSSRIPG